MTECKGSDVQGTRHARDQMCKGSDVQGIRCASDERVRGMSI